jgi:triacylglycerol lipase
MKALLRCCLTLVAVASATQADSADRRECVVLLHGVALSGWAMNPLARALEEAGYRTINVSYPSRTLAIDAIARDFLPAQLRAHQVEQAPRLHFVAHSMGSLVVRAYLQEHRPPNLGRVVMLGPPNHGSAAADRAADFAIMRRVIGVNLGRLGQGPDGISPRLPPADYDLGIIAGTAHINPMFDEVLGGEHDGVVTLTSARLAGMSDFIALPHSHTVMLWRRAVHAQVIAFLRDGRFRR